MLCIMKNWIDLIDVETGKDTGMAIQLNLHDREYYPYWVWCPRSCYRVKYNGKQMIRQIKRDFAESKGWLERSWCFEI